MTANPEALEAVAQVEVTQEDRERAADELRKNHPMMYGAFARLALREGKNDEHWLIQAFARHRTAALTAARAQIMAEAAGMWRNGIGNTTAVIDIVRASHRPKASNKAFSEFDAALDAALDNWFKLTRNANPETWAESEALFKQYTTAIRAAGSDGV